MKEIKMKMHGCRFTFRPLFFLTLLFASSLTVFGDAAPAVPVRATVTISLNDIARNDKPSTTYGIYLDGTFVGQVDAYAPVRVIETQEGRHEISVKECNGPSMYDTTVSKTLDIYRDVEIEILCRPFTLRDKASASIAPLQLSIFEPLQLATIDEDVYGIRLNLFEGRNRNVFGIDVGPVNFVSGQLAGIEAGFYNCANRVKGIQLGFRNDANEVSGVQIGFANTTLRMHGLQIGFFNEIVESPVPRTILLNLCF